jgi:hypothetical protein
VHAQGLLNSYQGRAILVPVKFDLSQYQLKAGITAKKPENHCRHFNQQEDQPRKSGFQKDD